MDDDKDFYFFIYLFFFQGYMPKVDVLKRYDLMQFADVAKAVRWDFICCCFLNDFEKEEGIYFFPPPQALKNPDLLNVSWDFNFFVFLLSTEL